MQEWTDTHYEAIARLLNSRAGLSFRADDCERIERGIDAAVARSSAGDLVSFRRLLETEGHVWDDLMDELTVGETYFFREPLQFDFIRDHVLPDLTQRRTPEHTLRIWSAGCASGEEAYSLAMLLDQIGLLNHCHVVGTDVSTTALAKARSATYSGWSLRGAGASRTQPYVALDDRTYVVHQRIRDSVQFEVLNLATDAFATASGTQPIDLILCRNVLIYFDEDTVARIAGRFYDCLADGGWLITASGDPPVDNDAPFHAVSHSSGVYYQRLESKRSEHRVQDRLRIQPPEPEPPRSARPVAPVPAIDPVPALDPVPADARRAFQEGRYSDAIQLTSDRQHDQELCEIHLQSLARVDVAEALRVSAAATREHPLSPQLHYLHAVLLLEQDQPFEAAEAARRVLYLDRTLVVAHLTLGSALRQTGDLPAAMRAYRNAYDLCQTRADDEVLPWSDGQTAAELARTAQFHLRNIEAAKGATP